MPASPDWELYAHQRRVLEAASRWAADMSIPGEPDPGDDVSVEDLVAALAKSPFLSSEVDREELRAALTAGGVLSDIVSAVAARMHRPRTTTNTVLLNMPVGSGKTRTALALMDMVSRAPPVREFDLVGEVRRCRPFGPGGPGLARQVLCARGPGPSPSPAAAPGARARFLAVVPSNAIAKQWVAETAKVGMDPDDVLWIRNRHDWDSEQFERARLCVIRNAASGSMFPAFRHACDRRNLVWDAVAVDESHEYWRNTIPAARRYILLTATTAGGIHTRRATYFPSSRLTMMTGVGSNGIANVQIHCTEEAVRESIRLPPLDIRETPVIMDRGVSMLQGHIPEEAVAVFDAGMATRAMEMLGLCQSHETVDGVVEALLRKTRGSIELLQPLREALTRAGRGTAEVDAEIAELRARVESIEARARAETEGQCPVCLDDDPGRGRVVLGCSHGICADCAFRMIRDRMLRRCPICRDPVRAVHQVAPLASAPAGVPTRREALTALVRELSAENRRTVIFCPFVNGCSTAAAWQEVVAAAAGCGRDAVHIASGGLREIEGFRAGKVRFLVTCPSHMASGVDLSCATDMVLIGGVPRHSAPTIQQMVGRCQRPPRVTPLRLHALLSPAETLPGGLRPPTPPEGG